MGFPKLKVTFGVNYRDKLLKSSRVFKPHCVFVLPKIARGFKFLSTRTTSVQRKRLINSEAIMQICVCNKRVAMTIIRIFGLCKVYKMRFVKLKKIFSFQVRFIDDMKTFKRSFPQTAIFAKKGREEIHLERSILIGPATKGC